MKPSGLWTVLILTPMLINGAIWVVTVVPQRERLRSWHDARAIVALRPQLATLLTDSQQVVRQWHETSFSSDDPSGPMQRIQQLAGAHHVKVSDLQSRQQRAASEPKAVRPSKARSTRAAAAAVGMSSKLVSVPMELEVTGGFGKLARWLSAVESQAGFRIESWTLSPGKAPGAPNHLTVKMTAFLGAV